MHSNSNRNISSHWSDHLSERMDEGKISSHLNIIYFSNIGNLEVSAYKITEDLIVIVLKFQESIN